VYEEARRIAALHENARTIFLYMAKVNRIFQVIFSSRMNHHLALSRSPTTSVDHCGGRSSERVKNTRQIRKWGLGRSSEAQDKEALHQKVRDQDIPATVVASGSRIQLGDSLARTKPWACRSHGGMSSGMSDNINEGSPRSGREHIAWGEARLCERNPRSDCE
jgi:hypothetical protein